MSSPSFRYTAFLSYSSKDAAIVKRLHRKLEHHRIPRSLVGKPGRDGPIPKTLFPIFRDRDELPLASDLGSTLQDSLRASQFLIVVCSPSAAKSRWVDEEVRYFKQLGRENRIFALIVSGVPNGGDSPDPAVQAQECFPPSLKRHLAEDGTPTGPRTEPIAGDLTPRGDGEEAACLKMVAGMLGVGYNDLVRRELQQQRRRWTVMAIVLGIIFVMALYLWDFNRLKVNYYAALTEKFGEPEGVFPLSEEEASHRPISYRVESSRALVRSVERVNAAGRLQDDGDNFGAAIDQFHYQDNGQVGRIDLVDHNHHLFLEKVYDERQVSDSSQTIEFQRPFHNQPFSLSTVDVKAVHHTSITGQLIHYNIEGLPEKIESLDAYHNFTPNEKGVWGKLVHYNALGLKEDETNLDANGQPVVDQVGVATTRFSYDGRANTTAKAYFQLNNQPVLGERGFSRVVSTFDSHDCEISDSYLDTNGNPILNNQGYARGEGRYDDRGNGLGESLFGLDNKPILCTENYASSSIENDSHGNLTLFTFLGLDGKPTLSIYGVAAFRNIYDDQDNVIQRDLLGTDGKPINCKDGYSRLTIKYDAAGNQIQRCFFGVDGKPILTPGGIARVDDHFDERGNLVDEAYFGIDEKAILSTQGYARVLQKYDSQGDQIEQTFLGLNGELVLTLDGYAKVTDKRDEQGNPIQENYFGVDGQPCLHKLGCSEIILKYDDRGNRIEESTYDISGKPVTITLGYARSTDAYDSYGQLVDEKYFAPNGKPIEVKGVARVTITYDTSGKVKARIHYNKSGEVVP